MVRPIVVFLTLAVAGTATDHHHYQGMAVVTYQGEIWQAAFRMEDFDPVHTRTRRTLLTIQWADFYGFKCIS